jgi:hypothetical protein
LNGVFAQTFPDARWALPADFRQRRPLARKTVRMTPWPDPDTPESAGSSDATPRRPASEPRAAGAPTGSPPAACLPALSLEPICRATSPPAPVPHAPMVTLGDRNIAQPRPIASVEVRGMRTMSAGRGGAEGGATCARGETSV